MSDGEINVDSIDGEVSTSANIVGQLYPQGEKGDKGDPGNDGFSPTVTTEKVGKTTTITITDAEGEHTATILDGQDGQGSGDMLTSVYDTDHNGIVDNAEKVNGKTVLKDVPADAVFTDTTYTAGTGIDITGNVITNTQTSAEWGNITGTLSDQTDLKDALDSKANTSAVPTKVSDLNNDSGFIDKDVNNLTNYDTSTAVDTKISNSEEVLIGSDSGIKASHELWVDTNDVTPYVNSEISNEYGTAQNLGYSQEYQNAHNVVVSPTTPTTNEKVWFKKSKNLINLSTIIEGKRFIQSGVEYNDASYFITDYILVEPSANYVVNYEMSAYTRMVFYDSSRTILSVNDTTSAFTTPATCKYIRLGQAITQENNVMLEKGTTSSTYEAYVTPSILVGGDEIYNKDNQEIYSTSETRIGTWIDGKPIYRVVVSNTTGAVNTTKTIATISNLGEIARLDGFLRTSVQTIPGNFVYNNEQVSCYRENNNIIMRTTTSGYANQNCYAIIEYTKTTD